MKKLVIAVGLSLMAGSAFAACMGPYCWDDRGAYVAGTIQDGNGSGMPSQTIATINAACPRVVGQEVFCNNCVANGGSGTICVSTATTCAFASNFD